MKNVLSIAIVWIFLMNALAAQNDETLFGKSGLRISGVWGDVALGVNGFNDESTGFRSSGFGLEFNKLLVAGFGNYRTSGSGKARNGQTVDFDLDYGGFLLGCTPVSHKVLHPRFSFMMGSGKVKVDDEKDDAVFVVQPGIGAEVNVFRWFRIGVEGGYRFVSDASAGSPGNEDLSGLFGQVAFRFGWSWGE